MERYMYAKPGEARINKQSSVKEKVHKKQTSVNKDVNITDVLKDAETSKISLKSYKNELEILENKTIRYKDSIKGVNESFQNVGNALADFRKHLLNFYDESWSGFKDLQICFEDEQTILKNYICSLNCINPLFRKYEASFEMAEDSIQKRHEFLAKLKDLDATVTEMKEKKNETPPLNKKVEKDLVKAEKRYSDEHQHLMTLFPKILASRVECIFVTMEAYNIATKEFCSEIMQVNNKITQLVADLPRSNPKISVGQGDNMIVLNVKLPPKTPKEKKPSDFGLPFPPPPPKSA